MKNEVLLSLEGDVLRVISPEGYYMYEMDSGYANLDEVFAGYRAGMLPCRRCGRIRVPRPHDYLSGLSNCICADCSEEVLSWYRAEVPPPMGWAEGGRVAMQCDDEKYKVTVTTGPPFGVMPPPPRYGWRQFGRDVLLIGGFALVAGWILVQMLEELAR